MQPQISAHRRWVRSFVPFKAFSGFGMGGRILLQYGSGLASLQGRDGALIILLHQTGIADNVGDENRQQLAWGGRGSRPERQPGRTANQKLVHWRMADRVWVAYSAPEQILVVD